MEKHFLKLLDFTPAEIQQFLDTAADLKAKKKAGTPHRYLEGKNVALIFEKTSTRTRCAFEVAAQDLGMGSTYLGPTGSQIGVKESIADTARVLGRMYDGIEYRGFGQAIVEELAEYARASTPSTPPPRTAITTPAGRRSSLKSPGAPGPSSASTPATLPARSSPMRRCA